MSTGGPPPASAQVGRRPASELERAFYGDGVEILAPADRRELARILEEARGAGVPVAPAGAGAHAGVADPLPEGARVVSAQAFDGIAHYEPDDFTIGVGAGTPLRALREALRENGQEIAVDFPRDDAGTVGGWVARAAPGPRQGRYGPLTSFVLGVEGMGGGGRPFKAGGMVVKNVAGYQIGKLLTGSLGAAGFLLRINFKVRPLPARRRLHTAGFGSAPDAWEFVAALRASRLEPAALVVLRGSALDAWQERSLPRPMGERVVAWIFEGAEATVDWQTTESGRLLAGRAADGSPVLGEAPAEELLDCLAGASEPVPGGGGPGASGAGAPAGLGICRLAVLPDALPGAEEHVETWFRERDTFVSGTWADAATGLLTVRWTGEPGRIGEPVAALRDTALDHDGAARLLYLPPAARSAWRHRLTPDPAAALAARVLRAFDPDGLFGRASEPGRQPPSAGGAPS